MNVHEINTCLSQGNIDGREVFPKLSELACQPFCLATDFALDSLPEKPGIITVRGARQYGKSTWLQQQIKETVVNFGPGSAFYINGDELGDWQALANEIRTYLPLFSSKAPVRRLFIDEICAIDSWQKGLKILLDAGELQNILVVTTGSKAADLRHGTERLPGRKGRLERTNYIFTPVPFAEFKQKSTGKLPEKLQIPAYILSGGSPIACLNLITENRLPAYIIERVRDWIYGEFARAGRSRPMLVGIMECLTRFAGNPVGQSKLAREAGLANNTVAAGYAELLSDLLCLSMSYAWDASRQRANRRKPCKYHFNNLLVAVTWHASGLRTPAEYLLLPEDEQGYWIEWLVAQELWRRAARRGEEFPEIMHFWQSRDHEIDFVLNPESFLEVKSGTCSPLEFSWFPKVFPKGHLQVINANRFETDQISGITLEDFLLNPDT